jgi:mannose-6-phosphate isomerase-like protein (cupin superfamily)
MSSRHILCAAFLLLVPAIRPTQQTNPAAEKPPLLHSKAYRFEDLMPNPGGNFKMYPIFDGITTRGERLEMHESELRPGETPNPVHAHHNEEIIAIVAGTLDVTIGETTTRMGPGSAGYAESDDKIGIKLVGSVPAKYLIFSVGDR